MGLDRKNGLFFSHLNVGEGLAGSKTIGLDTNTTSSTNASSIRETWSNVIQYFQGGSHESE